MGKLTISRLALSGAAIVETTPFIDKRGSFSRFYCSDELSEFLGSRSIVNVNFSESSQKGSIRGLHMQCNPHEEMKLLRCIRGQIFDVIVDLRATSPTFLHWVGFELSAKNQKMIIIPEGFAHGFQSLEDDSAVLYMTTAKYEPQAEFTVHYLEPKVGIKWPLPATMVSDKDQAASFLKSDFAGFKCVES